MKIGAIALSGNMVSKVECIFLAELLVDPVSTENSVHMISALATSFAITP